MAALEEHNSLSNFLNSQNSNINTDINQASSDDEDLVRLVKKPNKRLTSGSTTSDDDVDQTTHSSEIIKNTVSGNRKSRIRNRRCSSSTSSDNDTASSKLPTRNKKKKLSEKFSKLKSKNKLSIRNSTGSDDENESFTETKENIVLAKTNIALSVCEPDESDDEENSINHIKKIIGSKSTLPTVKSKPMSAREAMENMQKIKSESNRMLREKEVSLPYHRPKALSLKDIMSRRRPAVSSDGKTLPIKMNEEQLKQYAMMLEERQKEMMELCKSDTDEDNNELNESEVQSTSEAINIENKLGESKSDEGLAKANDVSFDEIAKDSTSKASDDIANDSTSKACDEIAKDSTSKASDEDTESLPNSESMEKFINNGQQILENSNDSQAITDDDIDITFDKTNYQSINVDNDQKQKEVTPFESETIEHDVLSNSTGNTKINDQVETIKDYEALNLSDHNIDAEKNKDVESLCTKSKAISKEQNIETFSDGEIDYDDLDAIIENAELSSDTSNNIKNISNKIPKLTGAAGMVISLDDEEPILKPSGVELLKERFTYFAKLQNQEDIKKDREKMYKPGTQHIKLKQKLEEEIAEQRSMEWAKRLEEEKILKSEEKAILGDDSMEDIDKIEAKLEELNKEMSIDDNDDGECDEDLIEDDIDMTDKQKQRNPMIEDEAEESEDDVDNADDNAKDSAERDDENDANVADDEDDDAVDDEESETESSESENEDEQRKPKKGRILKAFVDSDDEEVLENKTEDGDDDSKITSTETAVTLTQDKITQDEELQLAQANKSLSEDIFASQDSTCPVVTINNNSEGMTSGELGTFSILTDRDLPNKDLKSGTSDLGQSDASLTQIAGTFTQNIVLPTQKSQDSHSLEFGDDIAALCTGKFYENQFISQTTDEGLQASNIDNEDVPLEIIKVKETDTDINEKNPDKVNSSKSNNLILQTDKQTENVDKSKKIADTVLLKSILDELDDPEFDKPKQNKFFTPPSENTKKMVIDSDDDMTDDLKQKSKKKKKKRPETRALQISDDEDEMQTDDEDSDRNDDHDDEGVEKVYEYDSEENEVEVLDKPKKKKRIGEFFENEAELTSEDEWAGSGDEDEAGLDRMEREEGDDEVFHQGKLQRELGQIHMREVLDQDKREVRLIQELLFEDADLGDGHRQRKFRWKNIDGEDESGTVPDELDTQEEEFESEEMWRKQRHEREMFLRKMQENDEDLNTSINRSAIIKANLSSRTMSNLIAESAQNAEKDASVPEKKTAKEIPSPKKTFAILGNNYHGSYLTRGRGTLARLAALATPLVADDDVPKILASARGNFVFTARSDEEPKVKKRKAEANVNTPPLIKKMRTKEHKASLFDRLRD
ncbi:unnamed protein product [Leptosia nina]|uniref:Claspin n=1 Tax=Leptosia nina TaxID=320188 RepID=A0AAV1K009_9NEOP